jgi:hypothetical protein
MREESVTVEMLHGYLHILVIPGTVCTIRCAIFLPKNDIPAFSRNGRNFYAGLTVQTVQGCMIIMIGSRLDNYHAY